MAETAGRSQHTSRLAGANTRTPREEDEDGRKEEEWEDEEEGGDEEEDISVARRTNPALYNFPLSGVPSRATPDIPPQAAVILLW